jgi:HlyD family secretion protein
MKNLLSKLFLFLLLAAIIAAIVYAFWPEPVPVDLARVERGDLRVTVDEDGKTRIREKYIVSAPLAGQLLRIEMDPGDLVEAGDTLLAVIKPRDPELLDARSVAQAEARVSAAEAAVEQTAAELRQASANQEDSERDLARVRQLRVANAATASELEDAELLLRIHGERLRSAKHAEDIAKFELAQAEAALLRSRPRNDPKNSDNGDDGPDSELGDDWNFPIVSPIDGRVLRVLQESSAVVTAGTELLEVGDPTDLEVEVDVLSSDAVKIRPGALTLLEHWGGDQVLQGHVRLVEPSAFTKISTLGVEEQRVYVIVDLVDPPAERADLGDGFRVEARIVTEEANDVLKVPTSALFRVGDQWAVFRVEDGAAHLQRVDVGSQNGLEAEIAEGLPEGAKVIAHPSDQIEDGVAVRQR